MCPAEDPNSMALDQGEATILVVEDEVLIRLAIAEFLRDNGYSVIEASSVMEARSVFLAGVEIDLVFSDITMPPGEDGADLAAWIDTQHPEVKVLLTSGAGSRPHPPAPPNVAIFIDKPYARERVLRHVREQLSKQ
jgi:DNA-binding NtrC family response regulator